MLQGGRGGTGVGTWRLSVDMRMRDMRMGSLRVRSLWWEVSLVAQGDWKGRGREAARVNYNHSPHPMG